MSRIVAEHDTAVVQQVKDSEPRQFDEILYNGDPTLGEALKQIVPGSEKNTDHSHQYGYALKLLCQVIGEWLPDDDTIADLEPLELNSPLEQYRVPIDIPANKDFPFISFLTALEVKREAERLASLDLEYPRRRGYRRGPRSLCSLYC